MCVNGYSGCVSLSLCLHIAVCAPELTSQATATPSSSLRAPVGRYADFLQEVHNGEHDDLTIADLVRLRYGEHSAVPLPATAVPGALSGPEMVEDDESVHAVNHHQSLDWSWDTRGGDAWGRGWTAMGDEDEGTDGWG